jgi:hypothetical protein
MRSVEGIFIEIVYGGPFAAVVKGVFTAIGRGVY